MLMQEINMANPKNDVLKSLLSTERVPVKFINYSSRDVDIIWLDYKGNHVKYGTIPKRYYFNIDTYVSHPWIFRDSKYRFEKSFVNNKEVYFPRKINGPFKPQRYLHVFIKLPVHSLKNTCLRAIREIVPKDQIKKLEIPSSLKYELLNPKEEPIQS